MSGNKNQENLMLNIVLIMQVWLRIRKWTIITI